MFVAVEPIDSGSDSVRIYKFINEVWTQIGTDIDCGNPGDNIDSDFTLSSDGSVVAVGAPWNSENGYSGIARVFKYTNGSWTQLGSDIYGEAPYDNFGKSISLSFDGSKVARVFDLSSFLSIDEFEQLKFKLYPNPASNEFTVQLNEGLTIKQVEIYNGIGQLVLVAAKNTISITNFSKGIYYVNVITDQGKSTKKIVVK